MALLFVYRGVHVGEVVLECGEVFVEGFRVGERDGDDS